MSWWKPSIDEKIESLQNQIDSLLIEMAGVGAKHDTMAQCLQGETIKYFMLEEVANLKSKHAELKKRVECLQARRDGLVAEKQMAVALKGSKIDR